MKYIWITECIIVLLDRAHQFWDKTNWTTKSIICWSLLSPVVKDFKFVFKTPCSLRLKHSIFYLNFSIKLWPVSFQTKKKLIKELICVGHNFYSTGSKRFFSIDCLTDVFSIQNNLSLDGALSKRIQCNSKTICQILVKISKLTDYPIFNKSLLGNLPILRVTKKCFRWGSVCAVTAILNMFCNFWMKPNKGKRRNAWGKCLGVDCGKE